MGRVVLVTGGARSGKSRLAEERIAALAPGGPWSYVATAEVPTDDVEMQERIARHQRRRDARWRTVEAPLRLAAALRECDGAGLLIDCVTLWLTNLMLGGASDAALLEASDELATAAAELAAPVVLVTNEVGGGIVPENALARRFRDLAGLCNQRLASRADEVVLVVAGLPLVLKKSERCG